MTIIVKLNGGLGNQLFQYAFARGVSVSTKTNFRLDVTPFHTYYKSDSYELSKFNIQEHIAKETDMFGFVWLRKHNTFFNFIYHRLKFNKILRLWYYMEKTFMYDQNVFSRKGTTYFDGFWQTEKYFKNIEDDVRKEITLKAALSPQSQKIQEEIQKTQSVSIHVRRFDTRFDTESKHKPWHSLCSPEYYERAIEHIVKHVKSPHFFIFSDNYEWAAETFKTLKYPFTLVGNGKEKNHEDMILMSQCKNHIIANSSFSWWGAWLNPRKDKIVVAPQKWFEGAPKNDIRDLMPKEWIKL
ncbi:MAG: alpha-1,2-fucosyltransferase [Patescibacteria group bacterium]